MINIEHLMAASAIPGLFPWQLIDNQPHWDAGLMANTPITPALKQGATEIIVVLLSPVGAFRQQTPKTHLEVAELMRIGRENLSIASMRSRTGGWE